MKPKRPCLTVFVIVFALCIGLSGCGTDVEKARNCPKCDLRRANLRDAKLRDANLRGAVLFDSNLTGADLRKADLREADLRDADLRESNLRGADLSKANLSKANLTGADLSDANLREANLTGVKIDPPLEESARKIKEGSKKQLEQGLFRKRSSKIANVEGLVQEKIFDEISKTIFEVKKVN